MNHQIISLLFLAVIYMIVIQYKEPNMNLLKGCGLVSILIFIFLFYTNSPLAYPNPTFHIWLTLYIIALLFTPKKN